MSERLIELLRRPTDLDEEWGNRALCSEVDPETFFPEKGASQQAKAAKMVCELCEVRIECLEYALKNDEAYGIWGGLSPRQRRSLKTRRSSRRY